MGKPNPNRCFHCGAARVYQGSFQYLVPPGPVQPVWHCVSRVCHQAQQQRCRAYRAPEAA